MNQTDDNTAPENAPAPPHAAALSGVEAEADTGPLSGRAVRRLRAYFWTAAGFSVVVNLLFLVSPMYMLQVYDRVMSSGSMETLIYLTGIAVFLLLIYMAADAGRKRALTRAGQLLGECLDGVTLRRGLAAAAMPSAKTVSAVANLSRVQGLLLQGTLAPIFDVPFAPLFIGILFLIHPVLGCIALIGALILLGLAVMTDRLSRTAVEEAGKRDQRAQNHLNHMVRQRAAIVSMGMTDRAVGQWQTLRRDAVDHNLRAGEAATVLSSMTRSFRQILQIAILGGGAALFVFGEISPGTVVAGSILMGRGLAPIDQTVAIWRQVILGRKAWRELAEWVDGHEASDLPMHVAAVTALPRPEPQLKFEEFAVGIPGAGKPLLPPMTVELKPGALIALLGPSGAGKTSFLQSVAGAWAPRAGTVRLGGRDMAAWDARDRGRYVGYLPQHVELLTGTVRENIARFTDADPEAVFDAARRVGCHDMILRLPQAYDTPIGEGGVHLSAGQRQSVGLARAFFGSPALILLDEPTAHLDANLAANLMARFAAYTREAPQNRGVTAIIATHDLRLINAADQVMVIQDRKVVLTPREEYLKKVSDLRRSREAPQRPNPAGTPITVPAPVKPEEAS
ncbi:type I secretion system permease/ATPase [Parvularcula dongshanensis]|uniref:PrtD family type I secretion system ABC transporter n=1 Tax=Parvularcula dongshanensis TaxID=1173995 RepID=A0A840I308_9PROT|nr:type I secretion system permease/ATPase [Parvularcula dongshanensis]MBB4658682.1 PrtD family type I secretion system ABC transporter [Parvularcula dongshanensis]